MILTGYLLLHTQNQSSYLEPGWIKIEENKITEVQTGDFHPQPDLGTENSLITPGLIDAHLHLPQFHSIGAHNLPLLQWLETEIFIAEDKWKSAAYAEEMTRECIHKLISFGTTSFLAFGTIHHESVLQSLKVAQEMNIQAAIGQVLMDIHSPQNLIRPTAQLIEEAKKLIQQFPPHSTHSRVEAAIAPRFALTCSFELMHAVGQIARENDALVETHLSETLPECKRALELYPYQSYTDIYNKAGLLTERTIVGHGIWLDEDERQLLAGNKTAVAHCPLANSFLRSGTMNLNLQLNQNVPLCLGSDIGAGYEHSMVRVARAMLETTFHADCPSPTANYAWWLITKGNAEVLGWNNIGSLQTGNNADLLVIQPEKGWNQRNNPLANLMFSWDDRWIQTVFVNGKTLFGKKE